MTGLTPQRTSDPTRNLARATLGLSIATAAIGLLGVIRWLAGWQGVTDWPAPLGPIEPNAAVMSLLLPIALLQITRGGWPMQVGRVIAGMCLLLTVVIGFEWLLGRDLKLDNLIWPPSLEGGDTDEVHRLGLVASVKYAWLAAAVFVRSLGRSVGWLVEACAISAGSAALFGLIALTLGAESLLAFGDERLSVSGSLSIALLTIAVVTSRPDHLTVRILLDPGPAGRATRRILPALAAFPIGGWLVFGLYEAGIVEAPTSVAIGIIGGMAYAAFLLSRSARAVADLDREASSAREARDRFFDLTPDLVGIAGPDARLRFASNSWKTMLGFDPDDVIGRSFMELIHPDDRDAAIATYRDQQLTGAGVMRYECRYLNADGSWRWMEWSSQPDPSGDGTYAVGRDISDVRHERIERGRLAAVVEQTDDLVIITDAASQIDYVNPAFERVGWRAADLLGQPLTIFAQGPSDDESRQSLLAAIAHGQRWAGEFIAPSPTGEATVLNASMTPVRDADGKLVNWIGIARDVTAHRRTQAELKREVRERADVAAALTGLDLTGEFSAVAGRVCASLRALPGVDHAALLAFGPAQAEVAAAVGLDDPRVASGAVIPAAASERLLARAVHGPWVNVIAGKGRRDVTDPRYLAGLRIVASAPIAFGARIVGLIEIGTTDESAEDSLIRLLPVLSEFAAAAGGRLGPDLIARSSDAILRAETQARIDDLAFDVVFQPIVNLASGEPLGYEALTRFRDGTRPDVAFASAEAVGLGLELEVATLGEAVRAAADLPAGRWLDLNVSPGLVLHNGRLGDILAARDRPVVLEVTEHDVIADYPAIRDAIRAIGSDIRVAVDDAGAGAANFAHIVELRPDFVKLDIGLVRGINLDPTRQALVVGLRHFARTAGCLLVAEGVETEAEAKTLLSFGIEFGQGYRMGRPEPASAFATSPVRAALPLSGATVPLLAAPTVVA
ncbi:MAG TPA: EAL domain-containing protein [Candidatus Polarisedimenticolia bacterium]|nr:EAL domain-containing protein [Candidatus Polarisedimenticolia bacterium]